MADKDKENHDVYEEHEEEGDYHFSEDEVNYEVEHEPSQEAPEKKEGFFQRLTSSKRMLVSALVFFGLLFIVYKMVSPTTQIPATEITETSVTMPPTQVTQVATRAPEVIPTQVQQVPSAPAVSSTTSGVTPSAPIVTPLPETISSRPPPVTQAYNETQTSQPVTFQPQVVRETVPPTTTAAPTQALPMTSLPPVIPVQSPVSTTYTPPPSVASTTSVVSVSPETDARMASISAQSEKLMSQLQAQYAEKVSEFAVQNKDLQNQLQSLNSRVATMENQLNQLVRALTRQQSTNTESLEPTHEVSVPALPQPSIQSTSQKLPYNVQAIIPGRAWLRSESGETVTVAEGDMIRNVGRITRIDPYDGVVEINTGSKTITLSYGNGS